MGGLGRGDERADLRLVVKPIAEGVGPERAELTAGGGGRRDGKLLRDRPERDAEERQDEREREEPQFPFPNAGPVLANAKCSGLFRSGQANERAFRSEIAHDAARCDR
jgi:hypothetical protein